MDQLPGNPSALAYRAKDLSASALAIQDAAEALFALAFAGSSQALDVIAENADELADKLKTVYGRYDGTASALSTYAVDLQSAHALANDAISDDSSAGRSAQNATDEIADLRRERDRLEDSDPSSTRISDIDDEIRDWAATRENHERRQHEATEQYARAQNALNQAAEDAVSRIDAALSSTNDGFLDHVGDFFGKVGEILAAVAEWIGTVLKAIIEAIAIATLVIIGLLLLPYILMGIAIWIAFVMPLLIGIAGLLLLTFLIPGLESWRVNLLAALVGVALPLVGGLLLWRVLSDVLAPDPTVGVLDRSDYDADDIVGRDAYRDANNIDGLYSLGDYLEAEGLTDKMGGEDRSVVDIRKVVGPDGVERWVVTLPSTQDWVALHGDTAATNDLDSNLALMLTPEMQTQYERAVLQAMEDAGIGSNDPVMLVGFSQGGIMAGHLAANRSSAYNFEAVLAYGAPIDAMNIPESTRVLSIQHEGDAVPILDATDPKPNTPNHVTVQVTAYDGTDTVFSHDNAKYRETAMYSPELAEYQDYFSDFSGPVVDQTQYTWQE